MTLSPLPAERALVNFVGDLDSGIALIYKVLFLNPNLAAAWFLGGFVQIMRGEPDNAIERLAYAMRSSPLDSEMYRMQRGTALAHLVAGRFDEAAPWAEKALRDLPSFLIAVCIIARVMRSRAEWMKRGAQCTICGGSIPPFAFPISRIGSCSNGPNISPSCRTVCDKQGCRNKTLPQLFGMTAFVGSSLPRSASTNPIWAICFGSYP